MNLSITYFQPRTPRPDQALDDRQYAAAHCTHTHPDHVATFGTLAEFAVWCRARAAVGRKGDAGYIIGGDCTTTRKEGGPAPVALIDQDEGAREPDWAALDEYEGFAWTTASHSPAKPSWRVVIPFVEPLAHGKLRCPFKGGHIRNRTQPAFLPTHGTDLAQVEWRWLQGTKRLDARELGGEAKAFVARGGSLLGAAFEAAGLVIGEQPDALVVRCPWVHLHSDGGASGSVVFHADPDDEGFGKFYCSRTECMAHSWTSQQALEQIKGLPAVAHELAHWTGPGIDGYSRRAAQDEATDPGAAGPTEDITGLKLAPSGHPWVLRTGTWCWLHDTNPTERRYSDAVLKTDVRLQIKRTHKRLVPIEYTTPKGKTQELTDKEFETMYEHRVAELKATYLARENTWDPSTCRLTLASLNWTDATPERDPDVEAWLRALAGPRYDRLAQWIASCVSLDRPAPALYIHGEANVGKSLLAVGLARLWQVEPAPFEEALTSFNEATASCPLMYADEGFPDGMSFNTFRSMVTSPSRRVNEKFKPKYPVEGYVRIILAANNAQALRYQRTGALTAADMQAIADRLLVINADTSAQDVLRACDADGFAKRRIASHALWLATHVALEPKPARMCARPEGASDVLEALQTARYAYMIRTVALGRKQDGVLAGDDPGYVWVNVRLLDRAVQSACMIDGRKYMPTEQDTRDFVNAFSAGKHRQMRASNEAPILWYHPLDAARLAVQTDLLDR